MKLVVLLMIAVGASWTLSGQDGDWRDERDIRKRVERGLDVGEEQLDASRKTYRDGDPYKAQEELDQSIDTLLEAYQMIVDEGEDMRKRSGRYKKIEIQLRGIFRKLEDYELQVAVLDRGPVERARQTVSRMQDKLLRSMFQGGPLPPAEKVKP